MVGDSMISEFSTMGSCSSRNIFNSSINKNYKDFFHINQCMETVSLISLMSKPFKYDDNLITCEDSFEKDCVINDLSKKFLTFIKNSKIDYLVLDTYVDVVFNILIFDDETFMTDSYCLKKTELYKQFEGKRRINILENFEEYFSLYKLACDSFFSFLKDNNSSIKVILNCSRSVYKYFENGKIHTHDELKKDTIHENSRNVLDGYILENYDVDVLTFDYNTLADINHIFGIHPTHYETKYYEDKTYQLNNIIKRNEYFGFDDEFNKEIRRINRFYNILKMRNINQQF